MARNKSHKHAKKQAGKTTGTVKARADQLLNGSSTQSPVEPCDHSSVDLMLNARPPARAEGRRCNPAPASDTNTMASQAKLFKQSSVEVVVRAGGTQLAEGGATDNTNTAQNDRTTASAPAKPAKKGCMLLRPLEWATSCVGGALSLARRIMCAPARLALAPVKAASSARCIAITGVHSAVDLGLRVMTAPAKLTTATLTAATRPAISLLAGICSAAALAQRTMPALARLMLAPSKAAAGIATSGLVGAIRLSHRIALIPAKLMLATLRAAAAHCCTALSGLAGEPAEIAISTEEDPQAVIASEDSSQPLLTIGITLNAVHTPAAVELPAPAIEAPARETAETFPQQALGALSAYAAVSKVEADLSDELAIRELVLSTTSFRDVKRRSLTCQHVGVNPSENCGRTVNWCCLCHHNYVTE